MDIVCAFLLFVKRKKWVGEIFFGHTVKLKK